MTSASKIGDIRIRLAPGEEMLRVEDLSVEFPIRSTILRRKLGSVEAVAGISFDLHAGETLGLVGESGCGKSTTGLAVLRLIEHSGGSIIFRGHDLSKMKNSEMRPFRREMQIVLQDPQSSLDPRLTVRSIIAEPIRVHGLSVGKALRTRVDELLELVGLRPAHGTRFPHEFSGGQQQRIGIARALALGPQLLVLDEPVSALDVSIQAQIVNLLERLQDELNLAYLFIAHDLSVVSHISDRIAVMYLGKIVETGTRDELKSKLGGLGTIGSTAVFIGLLGTVLGVITAFQGMAASGSGGLGSVSAGISEALVETAFGLFVAIPAVVAYNYFQGRLDRFDVEMSNSASEMIDFFLKQRETSN